MEEKERRGGEGRTPERLTLGPRRATIQAGASFRLGCPLAGQTLLVQIFFSPARTWGEGLQMMELRTGSLAEESNSLNRLCSKSWARAQAMFVTQLGPQTLEGSWKFPPWWFHRGAFHCGARTMWVLCGRLAGFIVYPGSVAHSRWLYHRWMVCQQGR